MTVAEIMTTCRQVGIRLAPRGDALRVTAQTGTLTPELCDILKARKLELLPVLVRLDGMRRTVGKVPVPCARLDPCGGPGRCFSCGDALSHPEAYGRCVPCDIASELFYRECPDTADRWTPADRAGATR